MRGKGEAELPRDAGAVWEGEDRGLKNVGSFFKERGHAEVARWGVGDGIDLI